MLKPRGSIVLELPLTERQLDELSSDDLLAWYRNNMKLRREAAAHAEQAPTTKALKKNMKKAAAKVAMQEAKKSVKAKRRKQ